MVKCPEMTEGCFVVVFSMFKEGGLRSTSCNLDCRGSVVTNSPLVCGRFGVGWSWVEQGGAELGRMERGGVGVG